MSQSDARRRRRLANRQYKKDTAFISNLNIPDTYTKICLDVPHGLTRYQVAVFMDYIDRRKLIDEKFKAVIDHLDKLIENALKDNLKDSIDNESDNNC